jgi:hypothetical protein
MRFNFRMLGTPEYLLARAGLFDAQGEATAELRRLFGSADLPDVLAALVAVAYVCNAQAGGAIDVEGHEAVAGLKALGLSDGKVHTVFTAIRTAIPVVAAECRARPLPQVCSGMHG